MNLQFELLPHKKKHRLKAAATPNPKPQFLGYKVSYHLDFSSPSKPVMPLMPALHDLGDLASATDLSLGYLVWLCYYKKHSKSDHYRRFELPKRTGGSRIIASPKRDMAHIQHFIKDHILDHATPSKASCAYQKGRSITDCAQPHQSTPLVLRLDIRDFFSNIGFGAVRILFQRLGYNPGVSTCLALLCTDAQRRKIRMELDICGNEIKEVSPSDLSNKAVVRYLAVSDLHLPQGACTSPALSNLFLSGFDDEVSETLEAKGWSYSRYSDDLFFSPRPHCKDDDLDARWVQRLIKRRLWNLQLDIKKEKSRLRPSHRQQKVTGLVVNQRSNPGRAWCRRLRSAIHWCEKYSLYDYMGSYIQGSCAFLRMTAPLKAKSLLEKHPWISKLPPMQPAHFTRSQVNLVGELNIFDDVDLGARIRFGCLQLPGKSYFVDYICNTAEGFKISQSRKKDIQGPWYMNCAQYINETFVRVPSDRASKKVPKESRIYWALLHRCLDSGRLNHFFRSPPKHEVEGLHDRLADSKKVNMILGHNDAVRHYQSSDPAYDYYWDGVRLKKHTLTLRSKHVLAETDPESIDEYFESLESEWWRFGGEYNSFWEFWADWHGE